MIRHSSAAVRPAAAYLLACAVSSPAIALGATSENNLDSASTSVVETVVVTARHKSENAQNVPISLTAISADTLQANGVDNTLKLNQLVPSLQVISFNPRNTNLIIRGLGSNIAIVNDGIEAGVGVYVDNVFYPRPAQSTFNLPDIASLEELRGPQGTLYGKNTTAGAINITTEAPTDTLSEHGDLSLGDYAYLNAQASVSGPLNDDGTLKARLSGFDTNRGGFITNLTKGTHDHDYRDYGFRGQLEFDVSNDLTFRLIADYSHQHQRCCITLLTGVVTTLANGQALPRNFLQRSAAAGYTPLPFNPFARTTDADAEYHALMEQGGVSVQADWTTGGLTLTSITAARFWNWNPSNDSDATALSVLAQARQANQEHEFTQEFRIATPADQPVEFSGGLFYFWEQDDGFGRTTYGADAPLWITGAATPVTTAALNGFSVISKSIPRINSYAAYGQATWHVLPELDVTAGLRYTYEYKTGGYSQFQSGGVDLSTLPAAIAIPAQATRNAFGATNAYGISTSNNLVGGLATVTYKFTDKINAYATFSHGNKSSGMNLINLPASAPKIVAPEAVDNYELGFKSTLFDGRLVFNADAFWENDTNYQTTILTTTPPITTLAANIGGVRSRGIESDIHAEPIDGLSTTLSMAYTGAVYASYPNAPCPIEKFVVVAGVLNPNVVCNLSGSPLPAVSKWVLTAGAEYDRTIEGWNDLVGYVGADTSYRTSYFSAANDSIYSRVPGYDVTNVRIGLRSGDGHWDLSLWARNAFNTNYFVTSGPVAFNSGGISVLLGDPRTIGATLRVSL